MSALAEIYIKKETLQTLLKVLEAKGEEGKGVSITLSINDETNTYGQNVSSYVSQTKEQREAKKEKFFVGNGKVYWTNGTIAVSEAKQENQSSTQAPISNDNDPLPF